MPKIVDHEAYRREIIQKAIELFVRHGYEGLGMREVADHLGISKSALYHYFPSKEALFEGVTQAVVQADIAQVDMDALSALPFAARFDAFTEYILEIEDWYIQQYFILTDYTRVRSDSAEETQVMHAAGEAYISAIAEALSITREEAQAVYMQLMGVVLQRLFDGRRTDLRQTMTWLRQTLTQKYNQEGTPS